MLSKFRIALAATFLALTAVSASTSASAFGTNFVFSDGSVRQIGLP
jgi:hypothetical protein